MLTPEIARVIHPFCLLKLHQLIHKLKLLSICIRLVKVKAHSGIPENHMVDQLARNLAHKIEAGEVSAPSNVTVDDAYMIAADISMKSWQRFWDNTGTGRQTYDLIPVVGTKVTFPNSRHSGILYSRMLLHDTLL